MTALAGNFSTGKVEAIADPPSVRFTWRIEIFSKLDTDKFYSEVFFAGGTEWRLLIFPKGNKVEYLSVYLDAAESETLANGSISKVFLLHAFEFSLAVVNQLNGEHTVRKRTKHQFSALENDWGFTSLIHLSELCDPASGYLVNDNIIVLAEVDVPTHDSEKEADHDFGLKTEGAELLCHEEESHRPSQENVEADVTVISGEDIEVVLEDLASTEAPYVGDAAGQVPSESIKCHTGTSTPPAQAPRPTSGTQSLPVNTSHQGSSQATPVGYTSTFTHPSSHALSGQTSGSAGSEDAAPAGLVRFFIILGFFRGIPST